MKKKTESKSKEATQAASQESNVMSQISTKSDLKIFLTDVRDRLLSNEAPAIFAMAAMKQVLTLDDIYELIDQDTKEILQEIWVKLSQSGFHLRRPPMLFTETEAAAAK